MAESFNAEIRAALRDGKRVHVAVSGTAGAQGLRLLLGTVVSKSAEGKLQPRASGHAFSIAAPEKRTVRLTARELQILELIARGLHNRQIAARIHRSIKTVEKHRQNLHSKLSTHEVAGLTRQALAMGLTGEGTRSPTDLAKGGRRLTARELEVLKLVAQGSGNKWIASELHRSIKTIDHHRENIMKKLNIHEVAGLTRHALSLGLL